MQSSPARGPRCPEGSKNLRFPNYVTIAQDNGKFVSLMHRPLLPPGNAPGSHFWRRLYRPQGHSAIGRIMSMKASNHHLESTNDFPICSTVPSPLCYRVLLFQFSLHEFSSFIHLYMYIFQTRWNTKLCYRKVHYLCVCLWILQVET